MYQEWSKANPATRLKRHKCDEWVDEVVIKAKDCAISFAIKTVERYKTSYMSGDEWRFSRSCQALKGGKVIAEDFTNDMDTAFCLLPRILTSDEVRDHRFDNAQFTVHYFNRGHKLCSQDTGNIVGTMLYLPFSYWEVLEQHLETKKLTDIRESSCCQPGCPATPDSLLKIIKEYGDQGEEIHPDEMEYRSPSYRQFCKDHLRRGDCSREDCDDNYELVAGMSVEDAQVARSKIKPAGLMIIDLTQTNEQN